MATGGDTIVSLIKSKREEERSSDARSIAHPSNRFSKQKQTNNQSAEVLALTYGALVRQLVADLDDVADVNAQLDTM